MRDGGPRSQEIVHRLFVGNIVLSGRGAVAKDTGVPMLQDCTRSPRLGSLVDRRASPAWRTASAPPNYCTA